MANTRQGTALTEAHRAQQLAVRAGTLRGLLQLWQAVDPTNLRGTINTFAFAAALLAGRGFDQSGAVAARYFRLFRRIEGVPGAAPDITAAARPSTESLAAEIRGAALSGIIVARRAGLSVPESSQRGLTRTVGTMTKLALGGGRMTLITAAEADRVALGWRRITSGDPCAFCRMLAARGPAYKSAQRADFEPHGGCGCTAEVVYRGDTGLAEGAEYARQWDAAQRAARQDGTESTGTSNNGLNNYRRYLAGGATASGSPVTEVSGQ